MRQSEICIVDATIRDGGLVNDFRFNDDFVRTLFEINCISGVDYMEFGYKASRRVFDPEQFGKWKFCRDEDIRANVGDKPNGPKIAVMADVGRCDFHEDILNKSESPIDMIRVATYLDSLPGAVEMIEDAANKGYEVSCNIMAISRGRDKEIKEALDVIGQTPANVLYIVDSYGALYPDKAVRLAELFLEAAEKYNKKVGIHAHNNQQLAFANTILAHEAGVTWMDATCASMGRGAGNCALELLLGYLENKYEGSRYKMAPLIPFLDEYMQSLKDSGVVWGYDLQYLMTGLLNHHPRTAIQYTKEKRTDHAAFFREISGNII